MKITTRKIFLVIGIIISLTLVALVANKYFALNLLPTPSNESTTDNVKKLNPVHFWKSLEQLDYKKGVINKQAELYDLEELEGQLVRTGGFGIPLVAKKNVTRFLMVPDAMYCSHVPPPPPNQIVKVIINPTDDFPGVPYSVFGDIKPFWIEGRLKILRQEVPYGENGFILEATKVTPIDM